MYSALREVKYGMCRCMQKHVIKISVERNKVLTGNLHKVPLAAIKYTIIDNISFKLVLVLLSTIGSGGNNKPVAKQAVGSMTVELGRFFY